MKNDNRPIANPTVVLREEFDDWAVLYDPDTGDACGLNPTAVLIWKLLDGEHTMDALLQEVRGHADRVPDDAAGQIASFVDILAARGLVGFEESGFGSERTTCPEERRIGLKPLIYEPPQLVDLCGEQAAYGATCGNGSAANPCCQSTGNLATSNCYAGNGRAEANPCCSGTCGSPDGCGCGGCVGVPCCSGTCDGANCCGGACDALRGNGCSLAGGVCDYGC